MGLVDLELVVEFKSKEGVQVHSEEVGSEDKEEGSEDSKFEEELSIGERPFSFISGVGVYLVWMSESRGA